MLAALSPSSLARMRFPLAELTKPEVRALAASAELPVASRADSQDLCFLAGTGKARFLARHAGLDDAPGEIVSSSGEVLGVASGLPALHRRAAQAGSACRRRSRCTCCARRRRRTRWSWARARSWAWSAWPCAERGCTVRARRSTPCGCATTRARSAAAWPVTSSRVSHRRLELELDEPFHGAAPGQVACLLRGDVVVGWATISAQ